MMSELENELKKIKERNGRVKADKELASGQKNDTKISQPAMEKAVREIQQRNRRVEADKAWELSNTRKFIIALTLYIFAVVILFLINAPNPYINGLVPIVGFWLSTLTLPIFKDWWIKNFYKR